jgi:thiol-disulfide isomerase/thioredoxin
MRIYFLVLISFLVSSVFPQTYSITAHISDLPVNKIILTRVYGDDLFTVDSLVATKQDFRFILPDNAPVGLYRLILGKTKRAEFMGGSPQSINLIFNKENISFYSNFNFPIDSLKIIESEENKIYYSFLSEYNKLDYRIQQIYPLLSNYPETTDFYDRVVSEFHEIQKEQELIIEKTTQKYPDTYAARIIKMYRTPFLEGTWTEMERVLYMREHFFNGLDFTDTLLLNSNIYTKKIIEFLSLYRNPNLMQSEQEDLFIEAVDKILTVVNQDRDMYAFVLDYLIKGFEKFKFEKVLTHIADNYMDESCETENELLVKKRMDAYRKMAIGNIASEIILEDINGNLTALSEIVHKYTLVLFWSTTCPHCNSMLPKLKKWYNEDREIDLEIFAISIDSSKTEWHNVVLNNQLPWRNCIEPGGWTGRSASDYNLYATPTMFILDRNRRILAKPVTFYEFTREVKKLLE